MFNHENHKVPQKVQHKENTADLFSWILKISLKSFVTSAVDGFIL